MSVLKNKIDFAVIVSVKNANPNGDPLNGNRPREDYDGFGEISDAGTGLLTLAKRIVLSSYLYSRMIRLWRALRV